MRFTLVSVLALVVFAYPCLALNVALKDDATAILKNSQTLNFTMGSKTLSVRVDYAVFSSASFAGYDPSGGADKYIYAYQIFTNPNSSKSVEFFSIGLDQSSGVMQLANCNNYAILGGVNASFLNLNGSPVDSANFEFKGLTVGPNKYSSVLVFTSNDGPGTGYATISGGGLGGMLEVAAPAPEPATMALLGLGGLAIFRKKHA